MSISGSARSCIRVIIASLIIVFAVAGWGAGLAADLYSYVLVGAAIGTLILFAINPAGLLNRNQRGIAIEHVSRSGILLLSGAALLQDDSRPITIQIGVALGLLLLLSEPIFVRLLRMPLVWSSNVPGAPKPLEPNRGFTPLALFSLVIPLLVLVPENANLFVWLSGICIWAVYQGVLGVILLLKRVKSRNLEQKLYGAVKKYDPEIIIFTSRPDDASYQITMWLPFFQRTGKRVLILATSEVAARALSKVTDVPVAVRRNVAAFEKMAGTSLGAIFYVNASSGNNTMIRYSQYTHVYIGHGDSDKPPSYNPTHAMYDQIFAAGQGAIDRYAAHGVRIPQDKFVIVGRPQVEEVDVIPADINPEVKTVLYAPTWRGHVEETMFQSLHLGPKIIDELLDRDLRVVFRPHPFSYNFPDDKNTINQIHEKLSAHAAQTGIKHRWGEAAEKEISIIECINMSDAMISDVSSVVSDFLYSRKPFVMMAISTDPQNFREQYPVARGAYVVDSELTQLSEALDELLTTDEQRLVRQEVRDYYLGNFAPETYSANFVNAVSAAADLALNELTADSADETEPLDPTDEGANGALAAQTLGNVNRSLRRRHLETLRYRIRVLKRFTGLGRFFSSNLATWWALIAWLVALNVPQMWGRAVLFGTIAFYLLWRGNALLRTSRRIRDRVGRDTVFFVVLLTALANVGQPEVLPSVVLLAIATIVRQQTRVLQNIRGVIATNLPGLRVEMGTAPALSAWSALLLPVGVLLTISLELFTDTAQFHTPIGIISSTVMAVCLVAFGSAAVQVFQARRDERELAGLITDYEPKFAVYFASNAGASYQFGMWSEYFNRLDRKFIVITRTVGAAREISAITKAPVIFRPTLRSLDEAFPTELKTVFYVNNAVKNTHVVERPGLTNVWLNHGDSEKPACYNPVHAMYDYIFAAGEAGIDRYERHNVKIVREKFVITGRPQVEVIARGKTQNSDATKTVLYAPTWRGPYKDSEVYSLPVARELVSNLLRRDVRVIFRAHPHNYHHLDATDYIAEIQQLLREDSAKTGRQHVWGAAAEIEMTVEDCFNESDAMICDISAVVSDYLQSEKPFIIMAMNASAEEIYRNIPAARSGYIVSPTLQDLDVQLENLLGIDPLRGARAEMRAYYLSDFPTEEYADVFTETARAVIDGQLKP